MWYVNITPVSMCVISVVYIYPQFIVYKYCTQHRFVVFIVSVIFSMFYFIKGIISGIYVITIIDIKSFKLFRNIHSYYLLNSRPSIVRNSAVCLLGAMKIKKDTKLSSTTMIFIKADCVERVDFRKITLGCCESILIYTVTQYVQ